MSLRGKNFGVALLVGVCVLGLTAGILSAAEVKATLSTTEGARIDDNLLDQYIDSFIPQMTNRLLVLTQCYGGNMANRFDGKSNTAVASATSDGQEAHYGGYDNDAANALAPGASNTGQSVHDAGTAGKHADETPSTSGGLPLGDFSLEPIVPGTSAVQSRHIVVYAGKPDSGTGRDNDQRDKIESNFAGQPNTTVTTVGGATGAAGWDNPGSAKGLRDAIAAAGAAIAASPDPSKEQFILYVTDHGDLHNVTTTVTTPVISGVVTVVPSVPSFGSGDLDNPLLPNPGFTLRLELPEGLTHPVDPLGYVPLFAPGQWAITVDPEGIEPPILLPDFEEQYLEFDNDLIGDMPGEGIDLFFPVVPEQWAVDSFFDVMFEVTIENTSGMEMILTEISHDTGPVPKLSGLTPGDFDKDGDVDLDDFGILKTNFGSGTTYEDGDADEDGDVDLDDFGILKTNFGGSAPVPEPTSAALLIMGISLLIRRRKREF